MHISFFLSLAVPALCRSDGEFHGEPCPSGTCDAAGGDAMMQVRSDSSKVIMTDREDLKPAKPEEWIKFSFDPDNTGERPTMVRGATEIFDFSSADYRVMPLSGVTLDRTSSDSLQSASSQLSGKMGISGSYGAFSGSVEMSAKKTNSIKTRVLRQDESTIARKYEVHTVKRDRLALWNMIKPSIRRVIQNNEPRYITQTYGTFYAEKIELGAILKMVFLKNQKSGESTTDMEAKVQAAKTGLMASVKASGEARASTQDSNSQNQIHMYYEALGGNTATFLSGNSDSVRRQWAATVRDDNLYPMKYTLAPLWELIEAGLGAAKGKAVRDYVLSQWSDDFDSLRRLDAKGLASPKLDRCDGPSLNWLYNDRRSGAFWDFSAWQPQAKYCNGKWHYPLGDVGARSHSKPNIWGVTMYAGQLEKPTWFSKIWNDAGSGGAYDGYVWRAESKRGYKCVASMVTSGSQPDKSKYRCLPEECLRRARTTDKIWSDAGSGARADVTLMRVLGGQHYVLGHNRVTSSLETYTIDADCFT